MLPQAYTAHCKEELNKNCIFIVKNRAKSVLRGRYDSCRSHVKDIKSSHCRKYV